MKLSFLPYALAFLTITAPAFAGPLAQDAYELSMEINREEPYLNRGQSAQIQQRLQEIRRILRGEGGNRPGPEIDYICVSRDNDDRDPWMIGYRNFTTVERVAGTVMGSKSMCENALSRSRRLRDKALICVSRDNDGRSPFMIGALDKSAGFNKLDKTAANSFEACQQVVDDMKVTREGALFCGSRDNDGRSPFVIVGYRADGSVSVGNESYNSYESCKNAL